MIFAALKPTSLKKIRLPHNALFPAYVMKQTFWQTNPALAELGDYPIVVNWSLANTHT
jgi:hypothetical protein